MFSVAERAIFRNIITWDNAFQPKNKDNDWVELPGPASLWLRDYDYERFGWEVESDKCDAEAIYSFITDNAAQEETPPQYSGMLKSMVELRWKKGGEIDSFDV